MAFEDAGALSNAVFNNAYTSSMQDIARRRQERLDSIDKLLGSQNPGMTDTQRARLLNYKLEQNNMPGGTEVFTGAYRPAPVGGATGPRDGSGPNGRLGNIDVRKVNSILRMLNDAKLRGLDAMEALKGRRKDFTDEEWNEITARVAETREGIVKSKTYADLDPESKKKVAEYALKNNIENVDDAMLAYEDAMRKETEDAPVEALKPDPLREDYIAGLMNAEGISREEAERRMETDSFYKKWYKQKAGKAPESVTEAPEGEPSLSFEDNTIEGGGTKPDPIREDYIRRIMKGYKMDKNDPNSRAKAEKLLEKDPSYKNWYKKQAGHYPDETPKALSNIELIQEVSEGKGTKKEKSDVMREGQQFIKIADKFSDPNYVASFTSGSPDEVNLTERELIRRDMAKYRDMMRKAVRTGRASEVGMAIAEMRLMHNARMDSLGRDRDKTFLSPYMEKMLTPSGPGKPGKVKTARTIVKVPGYGEVPISVRVPANAGDVTIKKAVAKAILNRPDIKNRLSSETAADYEQFKERLAVEIDKGYGRTLRIDDDTDVSASTRSREKKEYEMVGTLRPFYESRADANDALAGLDRIAPGKYQVVALNDGTYRIDKRLDSYTFGEGQDYLAPSATEVAEGKGSVPVPTEYMDVYRKLTSEEKKRYAGMSQTNMLLFLQKKKQEQEG